jgi:hypothetical protein
VTRPTNPSALENAVKALDAELEFQSSVVEASDASAKIESKSNVVEASDTLAKIESQSNVVSWRSWIQHVNSDAGTWSKRKAKRAELDEENAKREQLDDVEDGTGRAGGVDRDTSVSHKSNGGEYSHNGELHLETSMAADIDRVRIEVEKEQDEEQTTSASARRRSQTRDGDATRSREILFACSMCGFRGSQSEVELHAMIKHYG